jgi:hypothetical protein
MTTRRPPADTRQFPGDTYWFFSPDAAGVRDACAGPSTTHPPEVVAVSLKPTPPGPITAVALVASGDALGGFIGCGLFIGAQIAPCEDQHVHQDEKQGYPEHLMRTAPEPAPKEPSQHHPCRHKPQAPKPPESDPCKPPMPGSGQHITRIPVWGAV